MHAPPPVVESILGGMRQRFPLCEVTVHRSDLTPQLCLWARDAGGFEAAEHIDALDQLDRALSRIAERFETPSHWMAL